MFTKIGQHDIIDTRTLRFIYRIYSRGEYVIKAGFDGQEVGVAFDSEEEMDEAWEQLQKDLGIARNEDPYRNGDTSLASDEPTV